MRGTLIVGLLLIGASACVGKGKYNALMDDYNALVQENAQMSKDLQVCEDRVSRKPPSPRRVGN